MVRGLLLAVLCCWSLRSMAGRSRCLGYHACPIAIPVTRNFAHGHGSNNNESVNTTDWENFKVQRPRALFLSAFLLLFNSRNHSPPAHEHSPDRAPRNRLSPGCLGRGWGLRNFPWSRQRSFRTAPPRCASGHRSRSTRCARHSARLPTVEGLDSRLDGPISLSRIVQLSTDPARSESHHWLDPRSSDPFEVCWRSCAAHLPARSRSDLRSRGRNRALPPTYTPRLRQDYS